MTFGLPAAIGRAVVSEEGRRQQLLLRHHTGDSLQSDPARIYGKVQKSFSTEVNRRPAKWFPYRLRTDVQRETGRRSQLSRVAASEDSQLQCRFSRASSWWRLSPRRFGQNGSSVLEFYETGPGARRTIHCAATTYEACDQLPCRNYSLLWYPTRSRSSPKDHLIAMRRRRQ